MDKPKLPLSLNPVNLYDAEDKCIAIFSIDVTEDHAQFIVQACNSYEMLVSALDRTTHALELAFSQKPLRDMAETLAEARAALSQARGEG